MKKTVNSLSGGRTSSYMAVHYPADYNVFAVVCIDDPECAPEDPAVLRYAQDKLSHSVWEHGEFIATGEDDRTLKAMMELEQVIGREIIWLRGKSYDDVIDDGTKTWLPSWARRYCTTQMKLIPIFKWWFRELGEKVDMRIGFRANEFKRMLDFFNYSDPTNFKYPVSCSTMGQRKQRHDTFNWRYCSMPLIQDGITEAMIKDFWANHRIPANLFEPERQMVFPAVSNCVGCFHKKPETLAAMAEINRNKMEWFARQEEKGKGTWLDSKQTYAEIIANRIEIGKEVVLEAIENYIMCDSGGCTG